MAALDLVVRQGKALYAGISNYKVPEAREAIAILRRLGTPCLIHQPSYSMFNRWVEDGLLDLLQKEEVGSIAFSPLRAASLPTGTWRGSPPILGRRARACFSPPRTSPTPVLGKVRALNAVAAARGQSLAQMALAWVLRGGRVTSVVIGASKPAAG